MVYVSKVGTANSNYFDSSIPVMRNTIPCEYQSSISSAKKDGVRNKIYTVLSVPGRLFLWLFSQVAKFLRNYVFCCCGYSDSNAIDWEGTKDVFETIYMAIFPSKHGNHLTDRQKQFEKAFRGLSDAAQERFREHIGYVLEKRKGILDRAKQIEEFKKNRNSIKFYKDYFGNIANNEVLEEAVKSFDDEIKEKTK
ncbi:MAG: hypothetical protein K1000chlam3_00116 [Chlamydiae bacterium]|nr:hypothetical protein [Chlamydiota bacterium]